MLSENLPKIAPNSVRLPKFKPVNGKSWSPRTMVVKKFPATLNADVIFAHAQWLQAHCQWYPLGAVRTHNSRTYSRRIFNLVEGLTT